MDPTAPPPCTSDKSHLSLIATPLRDASATSTTHADGTPLLSLTQPPPDPSSCVVIIQNNYIAEGGTINIFSSHCNGSIATKLEKVATKLEHVTATTEFTPLEPPLMAQAEPAKHARENVVLSGNTFGECVMINVGSPNCTGASRLLSSSGGNLAED